MALEMRGISARFLSAAATGAMKEKTRPAMRPRNRSRSHATYDGGSVTLSVLITKLVITRNSLSSAASMPARVRSWVPSAHVMRSEMSAACECSETNSVDTPAERSDAANPGSARRTALVWTMICPTPPSRAARATAKSAWLSVGSPPVITTDSTPCRPSCRAVSIATLAAGIVFGAKPSQLQKKQAWLQTRFKRSSTSRGRWMRS